MKNIKSELAKKARARRFAERHALRKKQQQIQESRRAWTKAKALKRIKERVEDERRGQAILDPSAGIVRLPDTKSINESIVNRLHERSQQKIKKAASYLAQSRVAEQLQEALFLKKHDRATAIVMRTLACDKQSAVSILQAFSEL